MLTMPAKRKPKLPPPRDTAWDASRLRAAWLSANPVPTEIAARVGVTTETLRRWRHGLFVPDGLELRALAKALGTTADALLPPE